MKKTIRLNKQELNELISESVKRVLNETSLYQDTNTDDYCDNFRNATFAYNSESSKPVKCTNCKDYGNVYILYLNNDMVKVSKNDCDTLLNGQPVNAISKNYGEIHLILINPSPNVMAHDYMANGTQSRFRGSNTSELFR